MICGNKNLRRVEISDRGAFEVSCLQRFAQSASSRLPCLRNFGEFYFEGLFSTLSASRHTLRTVVTPTPSSRAICRNESPCC